MKINILTLFPGMFSGFINESIMKKAIEKGILEINLINIRDYAFNKHHVADDYPFGGGPGMLMKPEPLFEALKPLKETRTIYMSPQGGVFTQEKAKELAKENEITIIAGHYEGIDERVIEKFVDEEISIGDYVLTGGELPAMVVIDTISRMIPGVINNSESFINDSFYNGLLDSPQYTRPAEYEGEKVPEVLLSGHHENIKKWQMKESLRRTLLRRPDLIEKKIFSKQELKLLSEVKKEINNNEG